MRKLIFIVVLFFSAHYASAQLKFIERFEVPSEMRDRLFEVATFQDDLVSFRVVAEKGFNARRKLQYFLLDKDLKSSRGVVEMPMQDGFELLGYDIDKHFLYLLFTKGFVSNAAKYILQVNLETHEGIEYPADHVLDMELAEFLVQNHQVIFMGATGNRPVLQIYDLGTKSVHTLQGIYGNDTQILQIRKRSEINALEVVLSRKGLYRNRAVFINSYDMFGNLIQEVEVDQFGEPGQEILDGVLLSTSDYQDAMIGAFGLDRREYYQGMYIMDINQFGEFDFKLYTLEDFPNFYNYLSEKEKSKRDRNVLKELDKGKQPGLRNTYTLRDVRQTPTAYYIYFDQYSVHLRRSGYIPGLYSPMNSYRYDRWNKMGSNPMFSSPYLGANSTNPRYVDGVPEYKYYSAHVVKVSKLGPVIWDNSLSYDELVTEYPEGFGEIAVVGEDLYHMYVENLTIKLSFFRAGEKVFENEEFELESTDENERIKKTDPASLRLIHWYDRYYLLSGSQQVRYQDEEGRVKVRDVYFLTKVLVDGNLYQPESLPD